MEMTGGSMSRPGEVEMAKKMGSERVGGDARFFSIFRERGPGQPPERRPSGARKTKVMERRWKGDGTTEEGKLEAEQMWSRVEKRRRGGREDERGREGERTRSKDDGDDDGGDEL